MQIRNSSIPTRSLPRSSGTASSRSVHEKTFENCLKTVGENRTRTGSHTVSRAGNLSNCNKQVELGTISANEPTVSHLLIEHPVYGGDCWDIIHSESNRDKLYTRIAAGTKIYIDTESREIIWDFSQNLAEGNLMKRHQSPVGGDALTADTANYNHERLLIDMAVAKAAADFDIPRELIKSVIKAESGYQVQAVSPAGAQGLMQLMPETARELGVDNPFDIRQNIEGGTRYLKKMLDLFDGNIEQALAAYNAGPGVMKRHQGRIPYEETRLYVQQVLASLDSKFVYPVRSK